MLSTIPRKSRLPCVGCQLQVAVPVVEIANQVEYLHRQGEQVLRRVLEESRQIPKTEDHLRVAGQLLESGGDEDSSFHTGYALVKNRSAHPFMAAMTSFDEISSRFFQSFMLLRSLPKESPTYLPMHSM